MANIRVYQLAKNLGYDSRPFVEELAREGIVVKSHMSTVDDETAELVMTLFSQETPQEEKAALKSKAKKPKVSEKKTIAQDEKASSGKASDDVLKELKSKEKRKALQSDEEAAAKSGIVTEVTADEKPDAEKDEISPQEQIASEKLTLSPKDEASVLPPSSEKVKQTSKERAIRRHGGRVRIAETITVKELAEKISVKPTEVIKELMKKGQMTTINQMIDHSMATQISEIFGYEVEISKDNIEDLLIQEEDRQEDLELRAPVITIMGHVDHGKTRLLDAIRKANVMEGEAGGITQHIGAYRVTTDKGTAVFLDTPGHEAFTAMRARGAQVTDLVIIVVAANEGVMPQTREAIDHAKAAGVPIMVAMNKMDLADVNPDRVKQQLSTLDLIPEEWGGDTVYSPISAKENMGIDDLLDMAILQAELMELKANPNRPANGVVVEAKLDKGRGPVATVLVERGTLNVSDNFVAGKWNGKVRALLDDQGRKLKVAGPSTPVEILGFAGVPEAGDTFTVLEDEKMAREISARRQQRERMASLMASAHVSLESFMESVEEGRLKELGLILKADVQGSIEALKESLGKLGNDEVSVKVLHSAVGGVTETDVMLAAASSAVIVGFNVRPTPGATEAAKREKVEIRLYSVIYDAIDEIKLALEGILEPVQREVVRGHAQIRELFHVPNVGTIAGCYVTDGNIKRDSGIRLIRDSVVIYTGKISSLRRFKDGVNEVQSGYECGIGIENYNDIKRGDIIEPFVVEEVSRTL